MSAYVCVLCPGGKQSTTGEYKARSIRSEQIDLSDPDPDPENPTEKY